jgi:DNA modification methylase
MMHVCPLQFDIVERLIGRFTNQGETVLDPFGGIMTVPYMSLKLGRRAIAVELSESYFDDGIRYLKDIEMEIEAPTLFMLDEAVNS